MARHKPPRHARGVTLLEMLAVLCLAGVLYALAMPKYQQFVLRSNRTEGQALLVDAAARQARYYAQHQGYITSPTHLDELQLPLAEGNEVRSTSGLYRLHVEPGDGGYQLHAQPLGRQRADTGCATLRLDGIGKPGSSGTASALECWK